MTPSPNTSPNAEPAKSATPRTDDAAHRYFDSRRYNRKAPAVYAKDMAELETDLAHARAELEKSRADVKALREALDSVLPIFEGKFLHTCEHQTIAIARQALASTQEDAKPEQPPSIQVGDVVRIKKGIEPYSKAGDVGTVVVIDNEGDYWIDFKGRGDSLVEGNGVMCACPDHVEFVRRPSTQEDAP